jgi:hypothetical protein
MIDELVAFHRMVYEYIAVPMLILSMSCAVAYTLYGLRQTCLHYIQTGTVRYINDEPDNIKDCFVRQYLLGTAFIGTVATLVWVLAIIVWPATLVALIIGSAIVLPVRRARKKVVFMERLKGVEEQ